MLPYIEIFSRQVPAYGIAAMTGLLLAFYFLKRNAKKCCPSLEADAELAFFYGIVGLFFGAKALSLCTVLPDFISEIRFLYLETSLFLKKYLYSGFVFYGGLYGAIIAVWIYARACKLSFSTLLGILLPTVPLIHGIGRIGCFCMGCCYGKVSSILGIAFHSSEIAPNGIPLIPVQLLEAFLELLLFLLLAHMSTKKENGIRMLSVYLMTYGICRFCLEFCRGDSYRGFIGIFSLSQVISLVSILLGVTGLAKCRIRAEALTCASGNEKTS